jgi:hypothetical protein
VTAYALSTLPYADYQDHEIAIVLPFGAVLAARVLAKRLTQARLLPVLAVVACGYLVALGYGMRQPQVPARDAALASWLSAHHLTAGLSTYSDAGGVELASHGTVMIAVPHLHQDDAGRGLRPATALRELRGYHQAGRSLVLHPAPRAHSRIRRTRPYLPLRSLDHNDLEQESARPVPVIRRGTSASTH